jgi:hypothetical protein
MHNRRKWGEVLVALAGLAMITAIVVLTLWRLLG